MKMQTMEDLMKNLPKCEGKLGYRDSVQCGKPALVLADDQPKHLCLNCFNVKVDDALGDRKWLLKKLREKAPSISDEECWAVFILITEEICGYCYGSAPCSCWNDE